MFEENTLRHVKSIDRNGNETIFHEVELYRKEGRSLSMPYGHWTPRGSCLIAAALAQELAATSELQLASDLSCPD